MKNVKTIKIIRDLEKDGWYLFEYNGSHRQYRHPSKKGRVTVNGKPSDDIGGFLLRSIEKQSGLKF
ncbi:MAG: type II toxin-antitoxin system HicA family toxin [Odoribacteraceae bacterium]|jgi:predicted RNA binding protein YcfA (HicA-like mRNA interferase family)|nr:type II toxin-antitoxin system HicA family toxin [Odoribacteraceae bacterium]